MKQPTPEQIRRARVCGDCTGINYEQRYQVDFDKAGADRRKGTIHGWTEAGEYLGRFRTHVLAMAAGADVTKYEGAYFIWTKYKQEAA